jgi:hypothetical protein
LRKHNTDKDAYSNMQYTQPYERTYARTPYHTSISEFKKLHSMGLEVNEVTVVDGNIASH